MTAAEIIREALTRYAAQTVGPDRFLAHELAVCAETLGAAHELARAGWQAADLQDPALQRARARRILAI